MDEFIASVCKEAGEKLLMRTKVMEAELRDAKCLITELQSQVKILQTQPEPSEEVSENPAKLHEAPLCPPQGRSEVTGANFPPTNRRSLSRADVTHDIIPARTVPMRDVTSATMHTRSNQKFILERDPSTPKTNRVQDSPLSRRSIDNFRHVGSHSCTVPGQITCTCDATRLRSTTKECVAVTRFEELSKKYESLKKYHDSIQIKYRKERNIWKEWINHIESGHTNDRTPKTNRSENSPSARQPSDLSLNRRKRARTGPCETDLGVTVPSTSTIMISDLAIKSEPAEFTDLHTITSPKGNHRTEEPVCEEPMMTRALNLTSSQEPQSIDLDQVTIRKATAGGAMHRRGMSVSYDTMDRLMLSTNDKAIVKHFAPNNDFMEKAEIEARQFEPNPVVAMDGCSRARSRPCSRSVVKVEEETFSDTNRMKDSPCSSSLPDLVSKGKVLPSEAADSTGIPSDDHSAEKHSTAQRQKRNRKPHQTTQKSLSMSDYMIDHRHNNGISHAYHETVRGKAARRRLHASDCGCCANFYKLAGTPVKQDELLWRSPTSQTKSTPRPDLKQMIGRHRSAWRRSPTPPGFWDCDFPTTQELRQEKDENEERRSRKFREVERSAKANGKYSKRNEDA